jgi:hypothetical protein
MRWLGFVLPIVLAASCGRTALLNRADLSDATPDARPDAPPATPDLSLADGPVPDATRRDSPADQRHVDLRDGPVDSLRDLPSERTPADVRAEIPPRDLTADGLARDLPGEKPSLDAAITDGKPVDGTRPSTSCGALKALADQGVLTKRRSRKVTFAPDRSWIALRVRQEREPGIGYPDQLLRVALPSGEVTMLSDAWWGTVEALGPKGGMLVVDADGESDRLAFYENGALRTVATGVCAHLSAPDGSRLFVIRDCGSGFTGTLDVIDVASGTATTLAGEVVAQPSRTPPLAISPSGRYFAFLVRSPEGGETPSILHVADRDGKVYGLPSQREATTPWFATDELLLFSVGTDGAPRPTGSLRAHVPGSGDTSYALAPGGQAAGLGGYKVSADRRWLLSIADVPWGDAGWGTAGLLYAVRLDGTGENLLSGTLVPHWLFSMGFDSFAWSGDGSRAIYVANRGAIWASDPYGAAAAELSPGGWFQTAPVGDQVAVVESTGDARSVQLRVLALGSAKVVFSFVTDGSLAAPNFTPDARGLLFVNTPASGARQLRYFSASAADSVVLGEFTETGLDMDPGGYVTWLGSYPMDPTGCFTVVDTDLGPGPGTRLVLLPE